MAFEPRIQSHLQNTLVSDQKRSGRPLQTDPSAELQRALANSCPKDALKMKRRPSVVGRQISKALELAINFRESSEKREEFFDRGSHPLHSRPLWQWMS